MVLQKYASYKRKLYKSQLIRLLISSVEIGLVVLSILTIGLIIYDIGFRIEENLFKLFKRIFIFTLYIFSIRSVYNLLAGLHTFKGLKNKWFEIVLVFLLFSTATYNFIQINFSHWAFPALHLLSSRFLIYFLILFFCLSEISAFISRQMNSKLNPARLFAGSFFFIILSGAGLLMFPNATTHPIKFVDALFVSTSAVCVTGLSTIDVAIVFTDTGKLILMLLIQIGGLGVITFTSFLGLLLMGKTSLTHDMAVKDFLSQDQFGEVLKTLRNIIVSTLAIEALGALLIYNSIKGKGYADVEFAVFHAVSSFCNAGFSTLSGNLSDPLVRDNYSLHMIVAILIVIGGIGFPVLANMGQYVSHISENIYQKLINKRPYHHVPRMIALNSRIAVWTTFWLLLVGTLFFFVSEFENVMNDMSFGGRLVTSFFMSVTPRTAGFNTVDMSMLMNTTVLFSIFLMWVGASPISTGGGIKTTTFALAIMSFMSTLRGRDHVEVYRREVARDSVQKAFALIVISFLTLGLSITLVSYFEPKALLKNIIFECVSAMSTTGLSLNFTPLLTDHSKLVLILLMFFGRVGLLTIFSLVVKKIRTSDYSYPESNILIG